MAAKKEGAKAQPFKPSPFGHLEDEGAWTLGQVLLWITKLDIELVRQVKTASDEGYYFRYPTMPESKFYDPAYAASLEKAENDKELEQRIRAYDRVRHAKERPLINKARHELLQSLRAGKIVALDKIGQEIPKSRWQVIDLSSTEAIKLFRYPSRDVRELWPLSVPGKPTDEEVKKLVSELHNERDDAPKPKQDTVRHEVRSRLPGATFRQINAALAEISKTAKKPVGRPKKIKTQN